MPTPKLYDAATLPVNKPPDEYHPSDCLCDYGTQVKNGLGNWESKSYRTGSGHKKECPSHIRWDTNGRTWNAKAEDNPHQFTQEAKEILTRLINEADPLPSIPNEFLTSIHDKFDRYEDRTYISKHEINFLRSLKDRYL